MITSTDFCEKLREGVRSMVNGDLPEIRVNSAWVEQNIDEEDAQKLTPAYLRNITVREAMKFGRSVGLKTVTDDDTGNRIIIIRLKDSKKARVVNEKDIPHLESQWKRKFIKHLLKTTPRITDLEGDELKGAAIAIERFIAMIEEHAEGEE